jgi:membrane protein implicated in regulation of membrane protease activity
MSLPRISAFSIFLAIASIGFLFLVISFVFGELFGGHGDMGGHDVDHGDVHGDVHGVSIFSTRILSVFVTAFGGFGAIGIHLGYRTEVATGIGLFGGAVFGAIIYLFASFLYSQQASSDVRVSELVGRTAEVTVAIPRDGLGQVRCSLGESIVEKIARTPDGQAVPANASVRIESVIGETVLVRCENSDLRRDGQNELTSGSPSVKRP